MSCRKRDPTLTIRNISRALEEATDYHGLGIQLGLPLHELNKIDANYQRVERRKTEVLALWLQGPDPKWKDLIVALQRINLINTAKKIQEAIERGDYQADSWLKPESLLWRINYCCQRLLERGPCLPWGVIMPLLVLGVSVGLFILLKYYPQNLYRHQIQSKQDLYKSLAEIGQWEALCENLGVESAILSDLRYAQLESEEKKRRCLQAFYKQGDVCWETVVKVVMDYPFYDRDLAKRIAEKYGVDLPTTKDNT